MRLIIFLFFLPFCYFAQEPTFSAGAKNKNVKFNEKLKTVIYSKNVSEIANFLDKNRNSINDATIVVDYIAENGAKLQKPKPAIQDIAEHCIEGTFPLEILELYIKKGADIHADYFGKSIIYYTLDIIATKPKTQTKNAIPVLKTIFKTSNIGINQNYKSFLQPFSYLLRTNFEFLGNRFDPNYIDLEVIKFFVDNGANIESYDQKENGLLALAMSNNDADLISYLTSKNINVSKTNVVGKDPMFFAIKNENLSNIKILLENGYQYTTDKLANSEISNCKNEEIVSFLSNEALKYLVNYSDATIFINAFDSKKEKLLTNDFYQKLNIPIVNYPQFIALLERNNPKYSVQNQDKIYNFKRTYINSFENITDVVKAIEIFNLANVDTFPKDFKTNENANLKPIYKTITNLSFLNDQLKNSLLKEINQQIEYNKKSVINKPFFDNEKAYGGSDRLVKMIFKKLDNSQMSIFEAKQIQDYLAEIKTEYGFKMLAINNTKEGNPVFINLRDPVVYSNYAVINGFWYRRGIIADGSVYAHNTGFEKIQQLLRSYCYERNIQLLNCDYLGTYEDDIAQKEAEERVFQAFKQDKCNKCDIDIKKSTIPYDKSTFWGKTHRQGEIVMKNGESYMFDYEAGKCTIRTGWFTSEPYDSFELMLIDFLKKCGEKWCN